MRLLGSSKTPPLRRFPKRIGFSGTPSDLLPMELGKCDYERGSDGKMVSVMTNKEICSVQHLQEEWSAHTILDRIAAADPPRRALIDTGALITGLSNEEVAQYLIDAKHKLAWCEGVVFLDDDDKKQILVRATGRVQELDTCGIAASKRFAFYDQVHTTGMDIQHALDATAVLTLGKDMNFRDYVQGAFRMRQIGQGQKVELYIIPEVAQLIERETTAAGMATAPDQMLEQVTAWLVISSMRSERVQNNQLMVQNVANVWRKAAFREVKANCNKFEDVEKHQAIAAFVAGLSERLEASKRSSVEDSIATVLFVDHLPIVVPLKLKKLESIVKNSVFKAKKAKITHFEMPTDTAGKSCGMAFVEFASEEDAAAALASEGEYQDKRRAGKGHKPDGFELDKKHTLRVCPLKEQVVSSEEQTLVPQTVLDSLRVFEEDIDFSLAGQVPEPVPFDVVLQTALDAHTRWLDEQQQQLVQGIVDSVKGARISNHQASLEAEQTQEQEEEREKELEDEKEKEIEIEKFSDLAYSREDEAPVPWAFANLADPTQCDQFYGADKFHLFKRKALDLPGYVQFSSNYFNPKWSGERRLKNVVMLMEWCPAVSSRAAITNDEPLTEKQQHEIDRAIDLFSQSKERLDATAVMGVIQAACDLDIDDDELRQVVAHFKQEQKQEQAEDDGAPSPLVRQGSSLTRTLTADQEAAMKLLRVASSSGGRALDRDGIRRLLLSAKFREEYTGHFTVAISLSEAATIRRIMHLRSQRPDLVVDGSEDTALALRVLPAGNMLLDTSLQFEKAFVEAGEESTYSPYQTEATCEVMRFINCDMHFSESALNTLLRLLKHNTERERRRFFVLMIGCRRRLQLKFENTPVMKLFSIADEWALLQQRAQASFVRERLSQLGRQHGDAFTFIRGASPIIKAPEMLGAFAWLGDRSMTPREIITLVRAFDKDGDGGLNYEEFVDMLNTQVDAAEDDDMEEAVDRTTSQADPLLMRSETGTVYDHVQPMRTQSIARIEIQDAKDRLREQEAEEQSEREEREAIAREREIEQERENQAQPGGPNPRIDSQSDGTHTTPWRLVWWFTRPRDPKAMKWGGSGNVSRAAVRTPWPAGDPPLTGGEVTRCMSSSYIRLPLDIKHDAKDRGAKLDRYTVSMHVRLESALPKGKDGLALLATKDDDSSTKATAFVFVDSKGDVRFSDGSSLFGTLEDVRVHIKRLHWYVISITVDAGAGSARVFVNGKPHCSAEAAPQIKRQGICSLGETVCVFGSSEKKEMQGVKLLTMMTLQLNVLDDERAKAVYSGAEGFIASKDGGRAGCVELARLHSAVGYAEAEERIEELIGSFAEVKSFSRAEVVHALTTLYKAKAKKIDGPPVGQQLTEKSAKESMLGCPVEVKVPGRPDGKGKLLGYKVAGNRYGDTTGGLGSDGYCRVHFESGHPQRRSSGAWNVPMSDVTIFPSTASQEYSSTYKTVLQDDGSPLREFDVGTLVKVEPPPEPQRDPFGFGGYHDPHARRRGRGRGRGRGAEADRVLYAGGPFGGDGGPPSPTASTEDTKASDVFEVVKIGITEEQYNAARGGGLIEVRSTLRLSVAQQSADV